MSGDEPTEAEEAFESNNSQLESAEPTNNTHRGGLRSENSTRSKKQRLQWDEENLRSNELEIERNPPRMRIDEPKTPYHPASEAGSSTSGSAPQSPGSPAWIERDHLVGFKSALKDYKISRGEESAGSASDGRGSAGKSVHIVEGLPTSRGSSGEFERKRKLHYRNEFLARKASLDSEDEDSESDQVERSIVNAAEKLKSCGVNHSEDDIESPLKRKKDMNGSQYNDKDEDGDVSIEDANINGENDASSSSKSVQIVEPPGHPEKSSNDFERKRKMHYRNEFRPSLSGADSDILNDTDITAEDMSSVPKDSSR